MLEIAKRAISAIDQNGAFIYLYNLGIKDFKLTFYQDESKIAMELASEQETSEKAKTLASALNSFFSIGKVVAKSDEEKILINGFQKPFSNEKVLFVNAELPKNTVHEIINRNLMNYKSRKLSEQK